MFQRQTSPSQLTRSGTRWIHLDQFPPAPASESDRKRHNHMIGAAHCAHLSPRVRPMVTSRDRARPPPGPPDTTNRLHWIDPPTLHQLLIKYLYYFKIIVLLVYKKNPPIFGSMSLNHLFFSNLIKANQKNFIVESSRHVSLASYLVLNPR